MIPSWVELIAVASACAGATPIVTALVVQWHWPAWLKTVVGLILAGAAAFAGCAILLPRAPSSVAEWITLAVAVVTSTQAAYRLLWKPAGVERVEAATTIGGTPGTSSAGF